MDAKSAGVLVDEHFGGDIPKLAREHGLKLAMPVEKSGQNEFDFQYGDDFGEHIESFDPAFSKVLVRFNPDGDAEMNERQLERLKRLADWLHEHDRLFLFELLVPATDDQLEQVGGDSDRYDAELRPELMRRAIEAIQDFGIEVDVPIAPVNTPHTVQADRQFKDRLNWFSQDDLGADQLPFPVKVAGSEPLVPGKAPTVGEHTDEWLAEIPQVTEWFEKFGDKLPAVLWAELDALKARLAVDNA